MFSLGRGDFAAPQLQADGVLRFYKHFVPPGLKETTVEPLAPFVTANFRNTKVNH
jgi:hypothetical protein